jgi:hypothetical protein
MLDKGENRKVREATHAGTFYPEDPDELRSLIEQLMDEAPDPGIRGAAAIMSPHAGYSWAGDLSALAWKATTGRKIDRIVILCPRHRSKEMAIFLPESVLFETPVGSMPVDGKLVEELRDCGTLYLINDIPHLEEHGVEVQLPFARLLHPEASIVPLLLGQSSPSLVKALASGLRMVFESSLSSTLFVISSDLESDPSPGESRRKSDLFIELALAGKWEVMLEAEASGELNACGTACLAAFIASSLAGKARLLGRHDSSSKRESEDEARVEYGALAFEPRS